MTDEKRIRPWSELRTSGLLWLINTVVLHPRGFALGVHDNDEAAGWVLLGDGREPWRFEGDYDEQFNAVETLLAAAKDEEGGS